MHKSFIPPKPVRVTPKKMGDYIRAEEVEIANPNFRRGTKTPLKEFVFSFMSQGKTTAALGDMICLLPAIKYTMENYNFILGHLIIPKWFIPIAENTFKDVPNRNNWKFYSELPERLKDGFPLKQQLEFPINAVGAHLMDLGFIYFLHMSPPPEGAKVYTVLDLKDISLPEEIYEIKYSGRKYVVMTPIIEATTRKMPASTFNKIVDYLVSEDVTPVFLGKTSMKDRYLELDPEYDLTRGVNLLDKTSLLEAAKVMENAAAVLGIDNGLLHLAAMTDTTILYGYTMAGPDQRRIFRKYGHTIELHGDKNLIPCLFCQERVRFFIDHNFTNCIYKEQVPACVKALNAESWIANLKEVLGE